MKSFASSIETQLETIVQHDFQFYLLQAENIEELFAFVWIFSQKNGVEVMNTII